MKIQKLNLHTFFSIPVYYLFFLLINFNFLSGKDTEYKVTRFGAADGLVDNTINCIYQDFQGFMWFGTRNGLHKYDGYTFKVYRNQPGDSTSIAHNWINTLYEDKNKDIWIGSKYYLSRYVRETDSFRNYTILKDDKGILGINAITEDKYGRIWITLRNRDIFIFDPATEQIRAAREIYNMLEESFKLIESEGKRAWNFAEFGTLTALTCKNSAEIWIGTTQKGLFRFNIDSNSIDHFFYGDSKTASLSHNTVKNIFKSRDSTIWIGTQNGLNRYVNETKSFVKYFNKTDDPYSIASNNIHNITEDNKGNIYAVTVNGWLNLLDRQSDKFLMHKKLASLRLYPVCVDRAGIIWIGSIGEGLFKLDPDIIKFGLYSQKPDEPNSTYGTYIQTIETDHEGNIWIGGEKQGIYKIDPVSDIFHFFKMSDLSEHPLVHNLCFDEQTGIWVATNNGTFILARSGQKINAFWYEPHNPSSISENQINNIFKDSKGNIWLATNILNLYDRKSGKFVHFSEFENNPSWYPQLTISETDICEDINGNFWMGTYAMGLLKFNPQTKLFKGYKKRQDEPVSVFHLLLDKKGQLWYSKNRQGLTLFDITTEKEIKRITENDGLLDNAVQGIKEDNSGNLWISSHRGLTKFNPENNTFKHYFKEDGLQDNEFRFNASHKNKKGEIFFAGQYGINYFYPDSIRDNDYIPPVVITDFNILVKSDESGRNLPPNISITDKIELSYFQNDITVSFAALHYSLPQRNQFSFFLENYDKEWRQRSTKNSAEYTNLDPGLYIFKVKGSNSDGVWNENPTVLTIIIYPPWWHTWWAYAFYFLFLVCIIYFVRRYELNRLHFKNQAQIEATKLKEREEVDRLKSTFFTNISHEFRTPLTLILGPLNKLLSQTVNDNEKKTFKIMQRNANRLLNLINQLLDISRLESGQMQLSASPGNIVAFLKGLLMSFHSLAEHRKITVDFSSVKEIIEVYFDREKAEKIFTNILSNAFKFTPEAGNVKVFIEQIYSPVSREGNKGVSAVSITITNTGPGIPAEKLPHIFDRFYQADASMVREQEGSGIGLALTKELVELHYGTISVSSETDKQTTFVVNLPVGKNHLKQEQISVATAVDDDTDFEEMEIEPAANLKTAKKANSEKTVVLVVEDNLDMHNYIYDTINEKYQVEQAFDGEAGVQIAREIVPDLIISDLMMPKKDGYQLCSEIKKDKITSHIPVILLTAKAERKDKLQGLETGADDYLIKPFDSQELLIRIKNLVEQRRSLKEKFTNTIKVEPKDITVNSMDAIFLQRAMIIVEENMENENFSVEMMSEIIGFSRRHLYQKIKALTDFTPTDFILNMRLKKAALLLSQKAGTVSEIAYKAGFNNLSYFARAFKKQFGTTPSNYTPDQA